MVPLYWFCNIVKLTLCSCLGFATIYFAHKLHQIILQLESEFGPSSKPVQRLKFLRSMLILMAAVYMLVDWVYDLALPYTVVNIGADDREGKWSITMQLLNDIRMQLTLCFVLLMLIYYHKMSMLPVQVDFDMPDVQAPLEQF